ncbi:MAG: hypothetical protein M3O87_06295 [Candidatus Dormibacteraeota bacterium]|nr:hypothetical protein [Candidatus Dormibacteraeota bacterium]
MPEPMMALLTLGRLWVVEHRIRFWLAVLRVGQRDLERTQDRLDAMRGLYKVG